MIRRACASVMGHPFPFCIRVTVAVQPARSLFVPRGRPKPHRPVSRLSSPPRVVRCPHFPCVEERYSRIFAASASEIQSAFFPCISLMVDAHFSLVAARADAALLFEEDLPLLHGGYRGGRWRRDGLLPFLLGAPGDYGNQRQHDKEPYSGAQAHGKHPPVPG